MGNISHRSVGSKDFERRVLDRVQCTASFDHSPCSFTDFQGPGESNSNVRSSQCSTEEGRDSAGERHFIAGFLQQVLRNPKEGEGKVALNPRSIQPECLHQGPTFQDGDSSVHQGCYGERRVGNFHRSARRLLPRAHPPQVSEVSTVRGGWRGFSVCGSPYGGKTFRPGIYQNSQPSQEHSAQDGHTHTPVFGRLAGEGQHQEGVSKTHTVYSLDSKGIRFSGERRQVRDNPYARYSLLRMSVPTRRRNSSSHSGEMGEDTEVFTTLPDQPSPPSAGLVRNDWTPYQYGEAGIARVATSATPTDRTAGAVEDQYRQSAVRGVYKFGGGGCNKVVVVREQCDEGSSFVRRHRDSDSSVHGRFQHRLGRTYRADYSTGCLDNRGEEVAHKHFRAIGDSQDSGSFGGYSQKQSSVSVQRQQHNSSVHKETGRIEIKESIPVHTEFISISGNEQCKHKSSAHTGQVKCHSRPALQEGTDYSNGVVNQPKDTSGPMGVLGETHDRSVRNERQQADAHLRVSDTGSGGFRSGCVVNELDRVVCVSVSPNSHSHESSGENQEGRVRGSTDSTVLASTSLVCEHFGITDRPSIPVTRDSDNAQTAQIVDISQQPSGVSAPCLEVITKCIEERGFSTRVARRMAQPFKLSSGKIYQSKWNGFSSWCAEGKIDPQQATVPQVADFLCHLHEDKHLAISTIEGYRTAINKMISVTQGIDIGKNTMLSNLIKNLERENISHKNKAVPEWNLAFVLKALTQKPFEPLNKSSLKYLTLKTVFLLALASGKRRSEVHAWAVDSLCWSEDGLSFTVRPHAGFVAKTQLAGRGGEILGAVTVQALPLKDTGSDLLLCPVRALRLYMKRTENIREGKKLLFVSFKTGFTEDIKKNTISGWIKSTVLEAYQEGSEAAKTLFRVKAHDVRAFSASWAFLNNVTMEKILQAGAWKAHGTFTNFYMKDMTVVQDEMMKLGPIVVASQVV